MRSSLRGSTPTRCMSSHQTSGPLRGEIRSTEYLSRLCPASKRKPFRPGQPLHACAGRGRTRPPHRQPRQGGLRASHCAPDPRCATRSSRRSRRRAWRPHKEGLARADVRRDERTKMGVKVGPERRRHCLIATLEIDMVRRAVTQRGTLVCFPDRCGDRLHRLVGKFRSARPDPRFNVGEEVAHRALTVEEIQWLLAATAQGPTRGGISGVDRAILHRLALETGLRAGEIRSLTAKSFDSSKDGAFATVLAAYPERRHENLAPRRAGHDHAKDTTARVRPGGCSMSKHGRRGSAARAGRPLTRRCRWLGSLARGS